MSPRQTAGDEPVDVPDSVSALATLFEGRADEVLFSSPSDGGWDDLTRFEVQERVSSIAASLVHRGLSPGDRVAIMSPTCVEWALADLAVMAAGGVTVPIYETSSPDQASAILESATPSMAFVADAATKEVLCQAAETSGTALDTIFTLDDGAVEKLTADVSDDDRTEVDQRLDSLRGSDLATLVYTSGTTGAPKGCRLTHRNLVWTVRQARAHLDEVLDDGDSTLLFLPLAHVFTRIVMFVAIDEGVRVGFARSIDDLAEDLQSFRPTFLLAVPRVFEKVLASAEEDATGLKAPVFRAAVRVGSAWGREDRPSRALRAGRAVADRLVYARLRDGVGGRVRFCVSGGAPLRSDIGHLFHAMGMTILEGYGLTETTAPAAVNVPSALRIGTVGRPLPGVAFRVADDGELLVRGESVFDGYHDMADATDEAMDDGWFRTGDLGSIDADGFVTVEGRKKDIIVTASGKNVAPGPLEDRLRQDQLIANAMVVGADRPFLAALVAVDPDELSKRNLAADDDEVIGEVERAVEEANAEVSRAESIREFRIIDRDFSEDDEELTHTMKLRRQVIAEHFADEIESIYADRG
jgi:long-chain acyl-CoA synthetase